MLMSDLQSKDIISMKTGTKIGRIIDIEVNNEGLIDYFIIGELKLLRRINSTGEIKINYKQIKTIGEDVILVEMP